MRPNIILMVADDLGYRDLSCFGGQAVETPNLDRLAQEGMKFSSFYSASAVCTPTRVSILTGRYPLRFDVRQHFNDIDGYLPESAITVAELLRDEGYSTAHVGKWHLGGLHVDSDGVRLTDQPGPRQHGFEQYQTQIEQQPIRGEMDKSRILFRQGGTVLLRNDKHVGEDDPYYRKHLTDANADFAIELLETMSSGGKPFFLNLWWLVPHTPYEPAPEPYWSETASVGISEDQHRFRSMVRHMDARIGDLLNRLEELGLSENTLVIFTSDNGAAYEGHIGELKGGKADLHEGGIRVPMIARWPGRISIGSQTNILGSTIDFLPTFCEIAEVPLPVTPMVDGISLLPVLENKNFSAEQERGLIFWQLDLYHHMQRHYPTPEPYATEVTRDGVWKLLTLNGQPVELFNVEVDPNERQNRLSEFPEKAAKMAMALSEWLAEERDDSWKTNEDKGE